MLGYKRLLALATSLAIATFPVSAQAHSYHDYALREVMPGIEWLEFGPEEEAKLRQHYESNGLPPESVQRGIEANRRETERRRQGWVREGHVRVYWIDSVIAVSRRWKEGSRGRVIEAISPVAYMHLSGQESMTQGDIRSPATHHSSQQSAPDHWLPYTVGSEFARALIGGLPYDHMAKGFAITRNDGVVKFSKQSYIYEVTLNSDGRPNKIVWRTTNSNRNVSISVDGWTEIEGLPIAKKFSIQRGGGAPDLEFELLRSETDNRRVQEAWAGEGVGGTNLVDARERQSSNRKMTGSFDELLQLMTATNDQTLNRVVLIVIAFIGAISIGVLVRPKSA